MEESMEEFYASLTPLKKSKQVLKPRIVRNNVSIRTKNIKAKFNIIEDEALKDISPIENATSSTKLLSKKERKQLQNLTTKISHYCDLHGQTFVMAIQNLKSFFNEALKFRIKYGLIIHGKGIHSEGNIPVLKELVMAEIASRSFISGYCEAGKNHGGSGATIVRFSSSN